MSTQRTDTSPVAAGATTSVTETTIESAAPVPNVTETTTITAKPAGPSGTIPGEGTFIPRTNFPAGTSHARLPGRRLPRTDDPRDALTLTGPRELIQGL